ncbi:MAG: hypothetical protein ACSHX7_06005 [Luteolibacter sp.]
MDPVNPWLDPSEVRHLAEQLLRPVSTEHLETTDAGFDSSFVGFADPQKKNASPLPERNEGKEKPQPAPEPPPATTAAATVEPFTPQEPEAPQPPPPSKARFLERIQIFRDWLAKHFKATDIFILDREGKIIFDESGHGRLHFMARNLAVASTGSGNIHVKIGPSAILEVIPCETPYGRIVLGTLVPEALPPAHIRTITEVLIQTASPA